MYIYMHLMLSIWILEMEFFHNEYCYCYYFYCCYQSYNIIIYIVYKTVFIVEFNWYILGLQAEVLSSSIFNIYIQGKFWRRKCLAMVIKDDDYAVMILALFWQLITANCEVLIVHITETEKSDYEHLL